MWAALKNGKVISCKAFAELNADSKNGGVEFKIPTKAYTMRFGVGMLMEHFLDDDYDVAYPEIVAGIRSDEYYVNMMIAWYFATALAKQYETVLPFFEEKRLADWTHNKAIQKCVESRRITEEQKEYLKLLKTTRAGKAR